MGRPGAAGPPGLVACVKIGPNATATATTTATTTTTTTATARDNDDAPVLQKLLCTVVDWVSKGGRGGDEVGGVGEKLADELEQCRQSFAHAGCCEAVLAHMAQSLPSPPRPALIYLRSIN